MVLFMVTLVSNKGFILHLFKLNCYQKIMKNNLLWLKIKKREKSIFVEELMVKL